MANTFRIKAGSGRGFQDRGAVLVNKTADGVDLDEIWADVQDALTVYNGHRSEIANLVSFRTTRPGDVVPQAVNSEKFELSTEFGQPTGISDPDYIKVGFSLRDYDKGLRATWKYLREATSEQITSRVSRILTADNELVNTLILKRLLVPTQETNDQMLPVLGLWNADGSIPPSHMGQTFDNTHNHYLTTGSTILDAEDVELSIKHIKHHGYGSTQSAQFILLAHPDDVEAAGMTAWRAGVEYRTGAPLPKYDFIVSSSAPAYLTAEHVEGERPPEDYNGLPVLGSYAGALVITSHFIPKGWATIVASGGPNSDDNPIGLREHENTAYQGLLHIAGNAPYPLQDSFFHRTIGTGVRHRGAAVALQIINSGTYTAPVFSQVP